MRYWNFAALLTLLMCASAAGAQEMDAHFALRGGFYLGNGFTDGLLHTHLEGFEVGGDIPIVRHIHGIGGLSLSPTFVFGGSNRSGADLDGKIYRLMVNLKRGFGNNGFYGGLGAGFSFTDSRQFGGAGAAAGRPNSNLEFSNTSGLTGQFQIGYIFNYRSEARVKPFLETSYFAGTDEKLSGLSFNAGVRF